MPSDVPTHFKDFLQVLGRKILERTVIYKGPDSPGNEEKPHESDPDNETSKYDACQTMSVKIKTG